MLELSRSALPAAVSDFDRDPWLLNVLNGTLDLRSGTLRPARREDMITKMAPVAYDPDASDPVFDAFLATVTDGDEELSTWLQRGIGYSLSGDMTEEFMVMILGPTLTGKSTLLHAVADMLGDYGYKAGIDTFLERRDAGTARPDLTALRGSRFVIATEAPKGKRLDEPLVKAIVGGDSLTARTLFHPPFTFYPQCKLWFGSNFAPVMNNLDGAIWRRVRRVPFEASFADHVDPQMKPYLCNNPDARTAILAWAVKGCLAWQRDGIGKAGVVERKTAELRIEMNPLTEYLDAKCVVDPAYTVDAGALRRDYTDWSRDTGCRPVSNKDWGDQLQALGCKDDRLSIDGKRRRVWRGLGLAAASRLSQEDEDSDSK
jgi:putative DNA primase/helicase